MTTPLPPAKPWARSWRSNPPVNVRKKLLWKLSTLALAFLLIAILALAGSGTSHGAPQTEPQRTAWSQPTPNWKAAGALRTGCFAVLLTKFL